MARIHLHIVRAIHGWRLQNANERILATFRSVEAAQEHGEATARQLSLRGINARVIVHPPGKAPKVFDFPALTAPIESYALSRCCLS